MDAAKLVDSMGIEEVVAWASLLQLEHDYPPAVDDDYEAKEDALRVALTGALDNMLDKFCEETGEAPVSPPEEELPTGIQLRLGALVREAMIGTLHRLQLTLTASAIAYDNFFSEHTKGDEEYRQRVSDYCCKYYNERHQEIVQLLKKGG